MIIQNLKFKKFVSSIGANINKGKEELKLYMKENGDLKVHNKTKVRFSKAQLFILYFFIFSFLGWVLETCYALFTLGHFVKRGFLYGPLCPIYGFGAIMLIILLTKYKKNNLKLFFYAATLFSAFEYLASYGLEALFSMHWWDYTNEFLNLNGRISIFYFFAWGIIAILFINHIYPFFKKKINIILSKIPYKVQVTILYLLCSTWTVDTIASCIRYL